MRLSQQNKESRVRRIHIKVGNYLKLNRAGAIFNLIKLIKFTDRFIVFIEIKRASLVKGITDFYLRANIFMRCLKKNIIDRNSRVIFNKAIDDLIEELFELIKVKFCGSEYSSYTRGIYQVELAQCRDGIDGDIGQAS